jgi:hypothetical protein
VHELGRQDKLSYFRGHAIHRADTEKFQYLARNAGKMFA